jgi:hypothetical protein
MTDPMSLEAQAARARKAQHNLATAAAEKMVYARHLADALALIRQDQLTSAHIAETAKSTTEAGVDTRLQLLEANHFNRVESDASHGRLNHCNDGAPSCSLDNCAANALDFQRLYRSYRR